MVADGLDWNGLGIQVESPKVAKKERDGEMSGSTSCVCDCDRDGSNIMVVGDGRWLMEPADLPLSPPGGSSNARSEVHTTSSYRKLGTLFQSLLKKWQGLEKMTGFGKNGEKEQRWMVLSIDATFGLRCRPHFVIISCAYMHDWVNVTHPSRGDQVSSVKWEVSSAKCQVPSAGKWQLSYFSLLVHQLG